MNIGPTIVGNPLRIATGLLVASYVIGEFIIPKYPLIYAFKLMGILGLISSTFIFISGFNIFKSYDENPLPTSTTNRIIKTGIFAYTRNPIYLAIVMFFLSMFLVFENVMYFLSAVGLVVWLHNYVIKSEENFLLDKFPDEYDRYMKAVNRWIFF
jgi:protein-S-isoprenylcysteine O-methyltransferase Ste14